MKNILKNKWILATAFLIIGLLTGWLMFHQKKVEKPETEVRANEKDETFTCAMHPQIRQNEPGKCPICGMDLIPVEEIGDDPLTLTMSKEAAQLSNIQTTIVTLSKPEKVIHLQGKVKVDERNVSMITARFPGRIEKLHVNFTGSEVKKGETMAAIYSPELVSAQRELFEAAKYKETNPALYRAAKSKLKLWNLSETQINKIEAQQETKEVIDIVSPLSGVVMERKATLGDYVKEGEVLFIVADLGKLWIIFDAYEQDIPWLKPGDEVEFTVQSVPGKTFRGNIDFIDPIVDRETRTVSVRVEMKNPDNLLKPEMFVNGTIKAKLPLEEEKLIVPKSAVLWTGKRSVVYVRVPGVDKPAFQYREVITGADLGDFYVVEQGLVPGEEVVTNGTFKVDAAAQLAGKYSMMNREETTIVPSITIPEENKKQIATVLQSYFEVKNALVASDGAQAQKAAANMVEQIDGFNEENLSKSALSLWVEEKNKMQMALKKIMETTDLKKQREHFIPLSDAMIQTVKIFDINGITIYQDFCPMANDDQGAYWLSETKDIKNPFMPETMLKCGEVKEVIGKEKPVKMKPMEEHQH